MCWAIKWVQPRTTKHKRRVKELRWTRHELRWHVLTAWLKSEKGHGRMMCADEVSDGTQKNRSCQVTEWMEAGWSFSHFLNYVYNKYKTVCFQSFFIWSVSVKNDIQIYFFHCIYFFAAFMVRHDGKCIQFYFF